jgi:hypothetical protein
MHGNSSLIKLRDIYLSYDLDWKNDPDLQALI